MNPDRKLETTHQLRIRLSDQLDEETLEDLAGTVDETVRRDACAALGLSVAIAYKPCTIKLRFQTVAPTASARAKQMSAVYAAIESALGRSLDLAAEDTRELVVA